MKRLHILITIQYIVLYTAHTVRTYGHIQWAVYSTYIGAHIGALYRPTYIGALYTDLLHRSFYRKRPLTFQSEVVVLQKTLFTARFVNVLQIFDDVR